MNLSKGELLDAYGRMRAMRAYHQEFQHPAAGAPAIAEGNEASTVSIALQLDSRDLLCAPGSTDLLHLAAQSQFRDGSTAGPKGPDVKALPAQALSQILGLAIARRSLAAGTATVCHLPAGAAQTSRTGDLLRAARDLSLPLIFVTARRPGAADADDSLTRHARLLDVAATSLNRCDFKAAYASAQQALARARDGRGPTLLDIRRTTGDPLTQFQQSAVNLGKARLEEFAVLDQSIAHLMAKTTKTGSFKTFNVRETLQ